MQPSQRSIYERRLQDSLLTSLAEQDHELGLGPEGPAVQALNELVMASAVPLDTEARLLIVTDAAGSTQSVQVLSASNDSGGWQHIADALKRILARKTLRVPSGSAGVSLQLQVSSRARLASGTDPGLRAEVMGERVHSGSDKSAHVSILPPKASPARVALVDSEGHVKAATGFTANLWSASADVADLGTALRRVVSARLVQLDVRIAQAASAPGATAQ